MGTNENTAVYYYYLAMVYILDDILYMYDVRHLTIGVFAFLSKLAKP